MDAILISTAVNVANNRGAATESRGFLFAHTRKERKTGEPYSTPVLLFTPRSNNAGRPLAVARTTGPRMHLHSNRTCP